MNPDPPLFYIAINSGRRYPKVTGQFFDCVEFLSFLVCRIGGTHVHICEGANASRRKVFDFSRRGHLLIIASFGQLSYAAGGRNEPDRRCVDIPPSFLQSRSFVAQNLMFPLLSKDDH